MSPLASTSQNGLRTICTALPWVPGMPWDPLRLDPPMLYAQVDLRVVCIVHTMPSFICAIPLPCCILPTARVHGQTGLCATCNYLTQPSVANVLTYVAVAYRLARNHLIYGTICPIGVAKPCEPRTCTIADCAPSLAQPCPKVSPDLRHMLD